MKKSGIKVIKGQTASKKPKGKVYLVGAGPGDSGLITLKGMECLMCADVVVRDRLAMDVLLDFTREGAEIIDAGKEGGRHTLTQDEINDLIISRALEGNVVVRLKGGDPFIFGRGGEEAQVLERHGIEFEVVPGVTSAIAVPAYAGIPLTHRAYNTEVTFVTGHEDTTKETSTIDWEWLGRSRGTLVFLMGVKNLEENVQRLVASGRSPQTPAALIQWGTTPRQKTASGSLENIAKAAQSAGVGAPAILVVGDVVRIREQLNWFEHRPLFGRRAVVTRTREQSSILAEMLQSHGAEVLEFPTIAIQDPPTWEIADRAIRMLDKYEWIIFTSTNGVQRFIGRLEALEMDLRAMGPAKLCAIGPATAQAVRDLHLRVDRCPADYTAEGLLEVLKESEVREKLVLLPRALEARDTLPEGLQLKGAIVDIIPVYQTIVPAEDSGRTMAERLKGGDVDIITFTSSSTVRNFTRMLPEGEAASLLNNVTVACIGPITARTAKELGIGVDVTPGEYTIAGLVQALVDYYREHA
ncbi:MAG: uroporphyrinogen-III C-methyltransferase [Deltaproteobacteria bacterium]|nr:uroporphyrinogen-III C-methyltransferase [Deltaproteobacteria bacterium]